LKSFSQKKGENFKLRKLFSVVKATRNKETKL
jgi:hypothetical protein